MMRIENSVEVAAARIESEMTDANKADWGSGIRAAKGGVFAAVDIELIKKAVAQYAQSENITDKEQRQAANLLHRLNNRM